MRLSALVATTLLWALAASPTTPALAQPAPPIDPSARRTALLLADEGLHAFEEGDFRVALEKLRAADQLVPATTLKIRVARSLAKLGRLREAAVAYRGTIDVKLDATAKPQHREAQLEAERELAALMAELPKVRVTLRGAGAERAAVRIDGEPVASVAEPVAVDPGRHRVEARLEGRVVERELEVKTGEHAEVVLDLAPPAAPAPARPPPEPEDGGATLRVLGWIGVGVGGAALTAGAITTTLAAVAQSDLEERCPERRCQPADHDDAETFNALRIVSTVTLVSGGVLAAGGVALVLAAGEARAEARFGPGTATARVRF
jgi:hypothetical protein